jgi:regulator of sigma E protease
VHDPGVVILAPEPADTNGDGDGIVRAGIEGTDLYLAAVPEGSSEWRAGLRAGDRIQTLDQQPVRSWAALVEDLVSGGDRTREIGWTRDGKPMTGLLRVRKEEWDSGGEHVERYVFRSTHWSPTVPEPLVDEPAPVRRAMSAAVRETGHVIRFIGTAASQLVSGKLTMRALSGPISIYDVAGRAGARGTREFLWVMALISINLGLLNLLPIPTLDGGQLLFLVVERVTGRPLPIRVREVLSFLGLLLLLAIMAIALRNDLRARL